MNAVRKAPGRTFEMAEADHTLSILHAGRSERANVAATRMVHLRTVRPRSDSQRSRFRVLLPQLPEGEAGCLIAKW
jgi:hypothetical protein